MDQTIFVHHIKISCTKTSQYIIRNKAITKHSVFLALQTTTNTKIETSLHAGFSFSSCLLNDSRYSKSLHSVKQVHAQIIRTAHLCNIDLATDYLIRMYSKFNKYKAAALVFLSCLELDALSWRYLADIFDGNDSKLIEILRELHRIGADIDTRILRKVLRVCEEVTDVRIGCQIHGYIQKAGFGNETYVKCALMDFYAKCGSFDASYKVFEGTCIEDSVLWNKVVVLNIENGLWVKALELFHTMQFLGVEADEVTIAKVLYACGQLEAVKEGRAVHGYAIKSAGISCSVLVSNSLITMYSKNSLVQLARRVFKVTAVRSLVSWNSIISSYSLNGFLGEAMELLSDMIAFGIKPDLVTWNCLISGHSHCGLTQQTFELFRRMQEEGLKPNSSTITSTLRSVINSQLIQYGKEIHGYVVRHGIHSNVYVGTSLVDMYVKCGNIDNARNVFDCLKHRNVLTWNSMISGYAHEGLFVEALHLLKQMGQEAQHDLTTWNGLISAYAIHGQSNKAIALIRHLKENGIKANVVSWTAIISGCCQNGKYADSIYFFREMQNDGIEPNLVTVASLLRACAGLALLRTGTELHCFATRKGFDKDIFVATTLIDMYAKSGSLKNAGVVFKMIPYKNLASWNAMINAFAAYGNGKEAILLFKQMCESGINPDGISFTALLSGCRHSSLVSEGWKYFDMMKHYNVTPTLVHYSCLVDILSRGGYLDEAWDFIESMPMEPDSGTWGALLAGCKTHRNLEIAEVAAKHLFRLEPNNPANYMLMMSVYASNNRWEDAEIIRDAMNAAEIKSNAGWSWIQIDEAVHVFEVDGNPHPETGEIYFELYNLVSEIKKIGYRPDISCIIQNVGEKEKVKLLMTHTEKLAVTYGLINTDKGTPIRVIKNTRACNDCHIAIKYLTQITGREIFLRDGAQFHHFKDGRCSCNDYW